MNKSELISAVAKETGDTKIKTAEWFNVVANVCYNAIKNGEDIKDLIPGLRIEVKDYKEKKTKDPRTNNDMVIPAHKIVKARTTDILRELLR